MIDLEYLRHQARRLCAERGIAILPYGCSAWWLVGAGVSRVVGELAGLSASDLEAVPEVER